MSNVIVIRPKMDSNNNFVHRTNQLEKCIFCDNPDPSTGEHLLSEWIWKSLEAAKIPYEKSIYYEYISPRGEVGQIKEVEDISKGKIKVLCSKCNNKWGGKLQDNAKTAMEGFLLGG